MQKAASFTRSAFGHIHENIVEKKSERIEIRYQILYTHTNSAHQPKSEKNSQVEKFDGWWLVYESAPYHTKSVKKRQPNRASKPKSNISIWRTMSTGWVRAMHTNPLRTESTETDDNVANDVGHAWFCTHTQSLEWIVCVHGNCLVTSIRTLNVTRLKIAFWSYEHSLIHSPWLASVAHSISLCSSFSFIVFSLSVCLSSFTNLLDGSVHKCYHESAWEMLLVRATEWVLLEIHTFFSTVPWNHLLIHVPFMMTCAFRRIITGVIAKVFELLWYIGEKVEINHKSQSHKSPSFIPFIYCNVNFSNQAKCSANVDRFWHYQWAFVVVVVARTIRMNVVL